MNVQRPLAIVNDRAGRFGSAARVPALLRGFAAQYGCAMTIRMVRGEGDARHFAGRAAAAGHDVLIVAGGDGTLAEAASGMRAAPLPLLILPTGSANLLARELNIPLDVPRALALLAEGTLRPIDCGYVPEHDRILLTAAILGVGTRIFEDAVGTFKNVLGYPAYVLAAFKNLRRQERAHFQMTVDGRVREEQGQMAVVANTNVGSLRPLHLGPSVRLDDGILDVIVFRHQNVMDLLSIIAGMVRNPDRPHPQLAYDRARDVRITAQPQLPIGMDGETLPDAALHVTVQPHALCVFVPRAGS